MRMSEPDRESDVQRDPVDVGGQDPSPIIRNRSPVWTQGIFARTHGDLRLVTAGDKAEVAGHQLDPLCTTRFRQSLAFAFEIVHARYVVQVARAGETRCPLSNLPIGDREK
jgi:hypothetical protein